MFFSKQYGLQPGDRVVERITPLGIITHHAIYLGPDPAGIEWVVENVKGRGVALVKATEHFKPGTSIVRIERFTGTLRERKAAVQRALVQVGLPYDLVRFNCEHFAEHVQHGTHRSRQVEKVGIGLAVLCLIGLLNAEF